MDEAGPGFEVHVEGLWGVSGARRVEDWEKGEGGEKERGEGGRGKRGRGKDPFCYDVVDVGSVEEVLEGGVWWVQVYVL